jgi:[acyl-carrier-protein] S-malonyltransferase
VSADALAGGAAWLFPGQGTDLGALPPEALQRGGAVRHLLDQAGQLVGTDLVAALRAGDPVLFRTELAQPALVAVTLGLARAREAAGEQAQAVAGHSLGELTAVAFAGWLTAEQALRAAVERGRLMSAAARAAPGGMAAIRCDGGSELEELLAHGRRYGALALAARNSPQQWVVSGDRAALGAVLARTPGSALPVAGPWHSPAMAAAAAAWEPMLRTLTWQPPRVPLVLAGTATFATAATDLPAALAGQLTQPVLWKETVEALVAGGITGLVSVGPGRVLKALSREIVDARLQAHPGQAAGVRVL